MPRRNKKYSDYNSLKSFLRQKLAANINITIRRTRVPSSMDGYCSYENRRFKIRICHQIDQNAAMETLLHEMAHVLSWRTDRHRSDHGAKWGVAYAKVYRWFLEWAKTRD
jgi:predicted SprT family Zn-dependent metalloprotease